MKFHFDIHVDERAKLGIFKINHIAQKLACNWNPWIQLADGIVLLQWWWLWKNFHAWPLNKSPCNAITKLSPEQKKTLAVFFQRRISMLNWFLRRIRISIPTGRLELFMLSIEFVMVYSFLWFSAVLIFVWSWSVCYTLATDARFDVEILLYLKNLAKYFANGNFSEFIINWPSLSIWFNTYQVQQRLQYVKIIIIELITCRVNSVLFFAVSQKVLWNIAEIIGVLPW